MILLGHAQVLVLLPAPRRSASSPCQTVRRACCSHVFISALSANKSRHSLTRFFLIPRWILFRCKIFRIMFRNFQSALVSPTLFISFGIFSHPTVPQFILLTLELICPTPRNMIAFFLAKAKGLLMRSPLQPLCLWTSVLQPISFTPMRFTSTPRERWLVCPKISPTSFWFKLVKL